MSQIPHGPDHAYCPYWRKKMSSVCHTCPMWQQYAKTDPATGAKTSEWLCAQSILPQLLIENMRQVMQNGAAVESARNEADRASERAQDTISKQTQAILRGLGKIHEAVRETANRPIVLAPPPSNRSSQSTIHALGVVAGEISTHKLSDQVSVRLLEQADDPK